MKLLPAGHISLLALMGMFVGLLVGVAVMKPPGPPREDPPAPRNDMMGPAVPAAGKLAEPK